MTIRLSCLHQNTHPQTCVHAYRTECLHAKRIVSQCHGFCSFLSSILGRMAAAWGADGRAYWQVPFWLPCGAWHWQGAAPVWKPQSSAASDGEVGLGVFSKVRRCNKRHTNPRARLLNYLRRSWHELNNKFTQCRGEQSFNVDEWVAEHVNIKVHLAHNAQQKSNPTPLTSCQIVEAQETLIFAFKAQQLGMHICWKRFC